MKRLIVLVLVLTPLALVAVDRLTSSPCGGGDPRTAELAFAFPSAPAPPAAPVPPAPPALPVLPAVVDEVDECPFSQAEIATEVVVCQSAGEPAPTEPVLKVESDLMANADRALRNLRETIDERVADWLAEAGVARSWKAPGRLVEAMILGAPEVGLAESHDYGDLYRASVPVDFSMNRKALLVQEYQRTVKAKRIGQLGGVLAFALACLAVVAGYIRTDEATKGYYTNRLRLLAAAALGGAGVALYHWIV